MKKIMTFSIILMPLIVLCILFLSGTIVVRSTYLYVEQVEFVKENVILDKQTSSDVSEQLQVNIFPILANNKEVEFWSENENIVVVDSNGVITSRNFGETYVYVRSKENTTKQAYCKVLVTSDHVHNLWAENTVDLIYVGDSHQINIKYEPIEATDIAYTLTSSNPLVVSVSPNGTLKALKSGEVTITLALVSNPDVNYSFTVKSKIRVESIYIDDKSPVVSGAKNFTYPTINFVPSNASGDVIYSSSNIDIATVDAGGNITFLKAGTVVIKAEVLEFNKSVEKTYTSTFGYFTNVSFTGQNLSKIAYEDYKNSYLHLVWTYAPLDADINNISIISSDENVIKIENNNFKVIGGGTATITIIAKTSKTTQKEAVWTIEVTRNVENISFDLPDFNYVYEKEININTTFYPQDASETINYSVSDTTLASIGNNKVILSQKAISNKFAKVQVIAYTQSGISKTITIAYIDKNIQKIILQNQTSLDFTLPKTGESAFAFALIVDDSNLTNVEMKLQADKNVLSQNGYIFTLNDKGSQNIEVFLNGEETAAKTLVVNVKREVENINDIKIYATWDKLSSIQYLATDTIYSSSNLFEFEYVLYPQNTTLTKAEARVDGDSAQIVDGKIKFTKAGRVTLILSADSVEKRIQIESTNLHPDSNTIIQESINLTKGQNISIYDYITISPANADKNYITFTKTGNSITIDENAVATAVCGGSSVINVTIATSSQNIQKQISVFVDENATDVSVIGDKYIVTNQKTLSITEKFDVLPHTATLSKELTFATEGDSVATISNRGELTFNKIGSQTILAQLACGSVAKINVVYVGDYEYILDGQDQNYIILTGTKIIIKPTTIALQTATYDQQFIATESSKAVIQDKIFITILESTTITFNGEEYVFDCVNNIQSINISEHNANDVDTNASKNITGLKELQLKTNVVGVDKKYLNESFAVNNNKASITNNALLTFSTAGEISVMYSVSYKADVVGAKDINKSTTYLLESTFGYINKVVANTSNVTHTIDETNSENNILNIADYISVYPTQLNASSQNIKLSLSNTLIATVNDLKVQMQKGGDLTVEIQYKTSTGFAYGDSLTLSIKRSALGIYMGDKIIEDGDTFTVNKSTIFLSPEIYPQDANINCEMSWVVVVNTVADVNKAMQSIAFKVINQDIVLKFTLGKNENKKEYTIYIQTTRITYEIDVESSTYFAPINEPFTFISKSGELKDLEVEFSSEFSSIIENKGDNVYVINTSKVGAVDISYLEISKNVKFVSVANISNITGALLKDVTMQNETAYIEAKENETSLITASKNIEIVYTMPQGYDKFGNLINYTISIDKSRSSSVASMDGNTIQFSAEGSIVVTISIEYEDAYKVKKLTYSFIVQSTFGQVTEFAVSQSSYSFVYDNMADEQKTIDIISGITRIAPVYGKVSSPELKTNNASIINIENNKAVVSGSGSANVVVTYGKAVKTINFVIDKYIDGIYFTENGNVVSQVVTKSSSYKLTYNFIAENEKYAPTLTQLNIVGDGCTISNDIVAFETVNKKYEITISAKNGSASERLEIIYVDSSVNVITANAELEKIVIDKNTTNIFDFRFASLVVNLASVGESISINNSEINTFIGNYGSSGQITFTNNQTIEYVVCEEVEGILFKADAYVSGYLTAYGSKADNKEIDLNEAYGASFYPTTARDKNNYFVMEYLVDDSSIAYVENNKLCFIKAGVITITFKAGKFETTRKIESTLGYAKEVAFKDTTSLSFEKTEVCDSYTLPADFYTVIPQNTYKANIEFGSSDNNVFTINNNKLTFVGGGHAVLTLYYQKVNDINASLNKNVFITNRAVGVEFYDGEIQVGYMVKNATKNSTMILDYNILSNGTMSDYYKYFESSNTSVAEINNDGVITFVGDGATIITLKIQDKTNSSGHYDCIKKLKLINYANYNIIEVQKDQEVIFESGALNVIYPMPNAYVFDFNLSFENELLNVSNLGVIAEKQDGETSVNISSADNSWVKTLDIYIHKISQITLAKENVLTAKKQWQIVATVTSLARKQVEYLYSGNVANVNEETGEIEFLSAGNIQVKVCVIYQGEVENYKYFNIESTFGKVKSFEISQTSCTLYTSDQSALFSISNIIPSDFAGDLFFESTDDNSTTKLYKVTALGQKSFKLEPLKAGNGTLTVRYDGSENFSIQIDVTIKQYVESIQIQYENKNIEELKTFDNVINLTAIINPTDASCKELNWSIKSVVYSDQTKTGEVVVGNGIVKFTENNFCKAVVVATAKDGSGIFDQITIDYVDDISGFDLSYLGEKLQTVNTCDDDTTILETIYMDWNSSSITLEILLPSDVTNFNGYANFSATSKNGSVVNLTSHLGYITISLPDSASLAFEDSINITYSAKYTYKKIVNIFRDGITKVDFGDLNNEKDKDFGLQQMRVFGKTSYYESANQNYRMTVDIYNGTTKNNEGLYQNIEWFAYSVDGTALTINKTYNAETGNFEIDFSSIVGSSYGDIFDYDSQDLSTSANYRNHFKNNLVTITAKRKSGQELYSYTFHIVQGVNVFNKAGFVNAGASIVLQKSFGHTDQQPQIDNGTYEYLDTYVAKNTIFGNGYLINYAERNKATSEETYSKWHYIAITATNLVNVQIQGANKSDSSYNTELSEARNIAYCELFYMYRAVELYASATLNVKNTLFRNFDHSTINASSNYARTINVENVIMFDVGYRAIEVQGEGDRVYIKGFFDVYNFQNKNALKECIDLDVFGAISSTIINKAKKNNMAVEKITDENGKEISLGEPWANVVCISTGKATGDANIVNYIKEDGTVVANGVPNISSVSNLGYYAWSTTNDHEYIKWTNEYIFESTTKRSLNEAYLISQTPKLARMPSLYN